MEPKASGLLSILYLFRAKEAGGSYFLWQSVLPLALFAALLSWPGCASLLEAPQPPLVTWEMQMFPIETRWSEAEKEIPVVLAGLPEEMPRSFVLPGALAAGNQAGQASGTAWAVGYSAFSYLQRHKRGRKEYICSPAFVYNVLNHRRNAGVSILASMELLQELGCPHEEHMPYRPTDYVYQPGTVALEDAARYRLNGFGRVDYHDLEQVKAHLLQGSMVVVRMRISENFVDHRGAVWLTPAGREVGVQALAVVGFDDERDVFIVQNSNGGEWGRYGRTGVPYGWFVRLVDRAYVLW